MTVNNVPLWLNKELLTKVLENSEGDQSIQLKSFDIDSNIIGSDNFSSQIYKVVINFSCKYSKNATKTVVVKVLATKSRNKVLANEDAFDTELKIYSSIIPTMEHSLEMSGEKVKMAPQLLHYCKDNDRIIIMEDLRELKYEVPSSLLDYPDLKVVIAKLAKFHANSIQMSHEGNKIQDFKSGMFNLKADDGLQFMRDNYRVFLMELKKWPNCGKYVEKFETLRKTFIERCREIYSPSQNGFNVLNHGDFHYKNIMAKKSADKVEDVVFLDYQLSIWATPAIDLYCLLYMVASHDARENSRTDIINYYYNELITVLTKLGHLQNAPGLLDLNIELLENGFLEVIIAVCFLPFLYANGPTSQSAEPDTAKELYSNPDYKSAMMKLLPKFLTMGLLD